VWVSIRPQIEKVPLTGDTCGFGCACQVPVLRVSLASTFFIAALAQPVWPRCSAAHSTLKSSLRLRRHRAPPPTLCCQLADDPTRSCWTATTTVGARTTTARWCLCDPRVSLNARDCGATPGFDRTDPPGGAGDDPNFSLTACWRDDRDEGARLGWAADSIARTHRRRRRRPKLQFDGHADATTAAKVLGLGGPRRAHIDDTATGTVGRLNYGGSPLAELLP